MTKRTSYSIGSILSITFFLTIFCCKSNSSDEYDTLISNVNVISMEVDSVLRDVNILIRKDRIVKIFCDGPVDVPGKINIIDGKGKYVIPGLADMHMHIDHPDVLAVNLLYGVTTVMNYRGLPDHLLLKEQAKQNKIFSPTIYTTGDYMEGYPAAFLGYQSFKDSVGIRASIKNQKEQGYDFIKVYRNMDSLIHTTICQAARENSMTVVGHLSPDISLAQSLESGQKVIAHVEELMYFFNNENDDSRLEELINLFKDHGVTFTPNLNIFRSLIHQVTNLDSILSRKELQYVHPAILQSWRKDYNRNFFRGAKWAKFMSRRFSFLQDVTFALHDAGLPIMASTDAPTSGAIPGLSVHLELEEFVAIGMTPFEALKTATVNANDSLKTHLDDSSKSGLIKEGYPADLIMLDRNPLENIRNTREIAGVMKSGHWYPKEKLDFIKNELANHYTEIDSIVKSIEDLVSNENIDEASEIYFRSKRKYPQDLFLGHYTMGFAGYKFLYENRALTEDSIRANKAVQFYQMYCQDYPNMHGSYYLLGMAYKAKKDTVNAIKYFERSLDLHPHNPYALKRLKELRAN